MNRRFVIITLCILGFSFTGYAQKTFETDTFTTSKGDLKITFIGHGTLMFNYTGKIVHIDPVGRYADYTLLPKADIILITHEHGDHLDLNALAMIQKENTITILTEKCTEKGANGIIMKNGDVRIIEGLKIEAVPAYNIVHKRQNGQPFHPKGDGNGYIINWGNTRIYIAGDTENTPDMKTLKEIDIAFLPMNVPYTMSPDMVTDAAKAIKPKILYPYHYSKTDPNTLVDLLKDIKETEVRIRKLR
jgi:L-ascorbate metabolism protein UlaG (beta-lactamase superfamily)